MNIKIINPIEYPDWDELLLTNDQNTFFHTSAWAKVLSETYNYKPLYFTVIENGKLSSLIPIMEIDSLLTGKRGISLPFADECHLILVDAEQYKTTINELIKYGKEAGWKHFELRGSNQNLTENPLFSSFLAHSLYLMKSEKKIFSEFRGSTKRNIKKAVKQNVRIAICTSQISVKTFYKLNCITRKLHGLPPQPWFFFENVYKHAICDKKGFVILASHKDKVIAGAIYFHFGNKAIYKYGASDRRYQKLRPNNLIMWEAIKLYAQNGFKSFSLGRTEPENNGLLQFKRGWRAKEEVINYYRYDLKRDCFKAKENCIKSSYNIFKVMPLPLLRLTGKLLYRHIG